MPTLDDLLAHRPPTIERPLLGLTVLVVEDSRYACEALRLMCLRSGARLRRADTLLHARRHLATYRPGAVIIDLGLPDGDGTALIREMAAATPQVGAILAISGDADACDRALAAGADGFLAKPIPTLGAFQSAVLAALPADRQPPGPRLLPEDEIIPDPIALRDDLAHAASLLRDSAGFEELGYAGQFLSSLGRAAEDERLMQASETLLAALQAGAGRKDAMSRLDAIVQSRLTAGMAMDMPLCGDAAL